MPATATDPDGSDLTVAILLENQVLCRGLEAALLSLPKPGAVHCCGTRDEIMDLVRARRIDVVIVSAAGAGWLETSRTSLTAAGTRVLALLEESSPDDIVVHAAVPADGFLSRQDLSVRSLGEALRRCRLGDVPMPPALARALLAQAGLPPRRTRPLNLTGREADALSLLARGMSNKQIARRLSISGHSAKRLVGSILLKLDSPNRTTAVVNAIKVGLVD